MHRSLWLVAGSYVSPSPLLSSTLLGLSAVDLLYAFTNPGITGAIFTFKAVAGLAYLRQILS